MVRPADIPEETRELIARGLMEASLGHDITDTAWRELYHHGALEASAHAGLLRQANYVLELLCEVERQAHAG